LRYRKRKGKDDNGEETSGVANRLLRVNSRFGQLLGSVAVADASGLGPEQTQKLSIIHTFASEFEPKMAR